MHDLQTLHRDGPPALPVEQWQAARPQVLRRWHEALGPLPELIEPEHDVVGVVDEVDHQRIHLRFRTSDRDCVPALLLVPSGPRSGLGIMALHPTNAAGKADVATADGRPGRRYGLDLVRRGHVVLAPDTITAGDRIAPGAKPYHTEAFVADHPGVSPVAKMLADHRQGVSLLASWSGVDPHRIGVIGHSLGGYNSWFLAGIDDRIRAVVSSCGFASFAGDPERHRWGRRDWFSHFPLLSDDLDRGRVPFEFHEVMALVAPKPLFNWLATGDRIFPNWVESTRALEQVHRLYESLGAADRFVTWLGHGAHDFPAPVSAVAYRFLEEHLAD
ncbi:MAG TPA: dienelactone hydrolase family protein [Candidatus Avipropionibacterium avicola]|uniref:Dienelactone hydrolase family protein n=1 Tax=Candidatus Avipropionibacterium avicola TaxID=2840701 RepID=A0A9D1GXX8_9ACTN|nr:dienelactone hydrolase family protein [Candidatus Avipropionibacterium avicola]